MSAPHGASRPSPDSPRPLPDHPSIEFERKRAKKLLHRWHDGDVESLRLTRRVLEPAEYCLADAQYAIACEYGFQSWAKLVQYFGSLERHQLGTRHVQELLPHWEDTAARLLRHLAGGHRWSAHQFAAFVPRFYALPPQDVLGMVPTLDEARLVVARQQGYPSWGHLAAAASKREVAMKTEPTHMVLEAIREHRFEDLKRLLEQTPQLIEGPEADEGRNGKRLPGFVLGKLQQLAEKESSDELTQMMRWLVERSEERAGTVDLEAERAAVQSGSPFAGMQNPEWVHENGTTALEWALIRDPRLVDRIANGVEVPKALWIAAGIGDIEGVRSYFDKEGRLLPSAWENRPDFVAMLVPSGSNPGAEAIDILAETFMIASTNRRFEVMDFLLSVGYPVDYVMYWSSALVHAANDRNLPVLEFLISRGADPHLVGRLPGGSAYQIAEAYYREDPNAESEEMYRMCSTHS